MAPAGPFDLAALREHGLDRMIWFAPKCGLVYIRNPKAGCSSIQKSLWLAEDPGSFTGSPHQRSTGPFNHALGRAIRNPGLIARATTFSVVRNPYSRLLSAYFDKVLAPEDRQVWKTIRGRLGISRQANPSLSEILERMLEDPEPLTMDQHLRPQYINLLSGVAPISFLGYLEHPEEVAAFLSRHGCKLTTHDAHARRAADRVREQFESSAQRLAFEYYRRDFELFGYGESMEDLRPVAPVESIPGSMPRFATELSRALGRRR